MPTSASIDRVAKELGVQVYEVPTGWKFFGNLMDAGKLSICGEESFGTGSDHIREKDGLWAVLGRFCFSNNAQSIVVLLKLAWLSILAHESKATPNVSLKTILNKHYEQFGRNYFSRYDYEEVESKGATQMITNLRTMVNESKSETIGQVHSGYEIVDCDDFTYTDPIDHSVSTKQGVRFIFKDGSRIIFRLSGTGSQGATIRLYVEKYSREEVNLKTADAIKDLIEIALKISNLEGLTGRKTPTVIT